MTNFTSFNLPPGIARQGTDRMLPGRWFDCNMVRWHGGVLNAIGGWERVTENPLPSPIRAVYGLASQNDARILALGCDDHIFALWESELTNITPEGFQPTELNIENGGYGVGDYSEEDYGLERSVPQPDDYIKPNVISLDAWGEYLVACSSSDGEIYFYDPADGPDLRLKKLKKNPSVGGSIPISVHSILVTPERHLLALGADGDPRRIAWCAKEDFGDWDYDRTNEDGGSAGYLTLDSATHPLTMKSVREGTLAFTSTDVFLIRYKGQPFIYGSERIVENDSLMSPYAVATFDGRAVWMSRTADFWLFDGGYVKPVNCPISDFLLDDMDEFWNRIRCHAVVNNIYKEVWFFYRSKDAETEGPGGWTTMWPLRDNTGTLIKFLNKIDQPPDATYFEVFDDLGTTRVGWANNNYRVMFEEGTQMPRDVSTDCNAYAIWNYAENEGEGHWSKGRLWRSAGMPYLINRQPYMTGVNQHVYRHEKGSVWNSEDRGPIFVESAALSPGDGKIVSVKQLIPDDRTVYDGAQATFFTKYTPEQAETVHGPYVSRPDGYMDVRFSGRDIRMRLEQTKDANWTVGRQEIDMALRGKR